MKDVGLRVRVQRGLREAFLEVCHAKDKPAAQVLRELMRAYVVRHAGTRPANIKVNRTIKKGTEPI